MIASRHCNGRKYFAVMMPITQDKRDCKTFCFFYFEFDFTNLRFGHEILELQSHVVHYWLRQGTDKEKYRNSVTMVNNDETTYTRDSTKRHMWHRRMTCYQQWLKRILRHRTGRSVHKMLMTSHHINCGKQTPSQAPVTMEVTGICFYTILFTYDMYFFLII